MKRQIITTQSFLNDLIALTKKEQKQTVKTLRLMENNLRHNSLQSHKVKGTNFIEVYVNQGTGLRLIYEANGDTLVLHRIGHHDILDKL